MKITVLGIEPGPPDRGENLPRMTGNFPLWISTIKSLFFLNKKDYIQVIVARLQCYSYELRVTSHSYETAMN